MQKSMDEEGWLQGIGLKSELGAPGMTCAWGLGPELLQVKRRLPAGRWGPVFRITDPGKRVRVGLSATLRLLPPMHSHLPVS